MDRVYSRGCGRSGTGFWPSRAGAWLAPLLILTACASDDHARREGRGEEPPRPSLFVSPAGEPFRAPPGAPYPVAAWFRQADANGDGKLTRDEFVADAARFFARLDANHDGVIDGVELRTYETEIVPEITEDRGEGQASGGGQGFGGGGQGGQGGAGAGRRGRRRGGGSGSPSSSGSGGATMPQASGAAPYGLLGEREPVAGADLDLDSRITLANFKTRAGQRFELLDVDGLGYLTLAGLPKTQAQKQAGRRKPAG